MVNKALLEGLNHALNREVTTFLRYMLQSAMIKGATWQPLRGMYAEEVQDEVGHALYLANQIVMLGGTPKLAPDLAPPPTSPPDMLRNDIEQEKIDVVGYTKLARLAEEAGLIALKMKMEEQAADESEHAQEMQRLLG
jgi:bacterioferritin